MTEIQSATVRSASSSTTRGGHRRYHGDDAALTYGIHPFRAQLNEVLREPAARRPDSGDSNTPADPEGVVTVLATAERVRPAGALGPVEIIWHTPTDPGDCEGNCDSHTVACGGQTSACRAVSATCRKT
ncbi:hypothetical protein O1L68_40140 [Streptomyces lydicus]|nr:hypothetical protein [Streptomyces lydicus]